MKTWACLGDSLTEGVPTPPTTVLSPWPNRLDLQLAASGVAVSNFGMTGTRLNNDLFNGSSNGPSMWKRYLAGIHNQPFYGLMLWGGINDILNDETGPNVLADFKMIVNQALEDGLKVIAVVTSPAAGYSGATGPWSPSRQTAIDTLRAGILALAGTPNVVGVVDLYSLMGDPTGLGASYLNPRWEGVSNDHLHHGEDAQTYVLLPAFLPLLQPAPTLPVISVGGTARPVVEVKTGDRAPVLQATLLDADEEPLDLNGATVTLRLQSRYGGTLKVNAAATVVDPDANLVQYELGATDTDTPGYYRGEFAVSYAGIVQTVPASGTFTFIVSPPLG